MRADSSKVILARGLLAELPESPKPCWFAVAPNRSGGGAYDAPSGGPTYRSGRSPDWLKIKNPSALKRHVKLIDFLADCRNEAAHPRPEKIGIGFQRFRSEAHASKDFVDLFEALTDWKQAR